MPDASLEGQVALVTGGARRVGRAIVLALADAGADVVVHYNGSATDAEATAKEARGRGVQAWTVQADLADITAAEGLLTRAAETTGRPLTLLVNNASAFPPKTFGDMEWPDLETMLKVHAWAPHALMRTFAAQTDDGAVVNLLDTRISGFDWQHVPYILSKQALASITRMAAVHYAPGIRVNGVAPGPVLAPEDMDEATQDRIAAAVPAKRWGAPEDVADAVVWLLGAPYTTGDVVHVDGGRHLGTQGKGGA